MDHGPAALLDHDGNQHPVQANRGQQVAVEVGVVVGVGHGQGATGRRVWPPAVETIVSIPPRSDRARPEGSAASQFLVPRRRGSMEANTEKIAEAEVMAVLDRRVEACRVKDIDLLMSLYAPDIVYFDIIPPHRFAGSEEVRRNFVRWFDEYQGGIGLETHELYVAAGADVAFAHMLHPDSGTRRSGQNETVWVRSTVCLERREGRWVITHEHISFPINPQDWTAVVDRPS